MARFTIPTFPLTITEGSPLAFTLAPSSALTGVTTVRWDIIQNGRLAALDSDFAATTGTLSFANGATAAQPVSITINNDVFRGENRTFSIRLTEVPSSGPEVQIGQDHAITLIEDDTALSFENFTLPPISQATNDTLVLGSSYTYSSVSGAAGDDTFIITKHQNLDLTINDELGANVIKFDTGVSITHVVESANPGSPRIVNSITLTLGTGAEITVSSPAEAERYQYQLGDGVLMDYAGFVAEIRSGGFENDADGNATTELSTAYAITAPALAPNSGTSQFTVSSLPDTITEGTDLSVTVTPSSALTGATDVRWDIIQDGRLAALDSDFAATTGTISFANGATAAQTLSITIRNDAIRGEDRNFSLRLTEVPTDGAETQIGQDHAITLIEDDTALSFRDFHLPITSQHDTLVLGSSYTYPLVVGGPGDDTFIITKHQNLNLTIDDKLDNNVIKFDTGVSITHVHTVEFYISALDITIVDLITLTLGTGAEITVIIPAQSGRYQYQLGDGVLMDYAAFVAEIRSGGFENDADGNATTELSTAIVITAPALAADANDAPVLNAVTGATITDNASPVSSVTLGSLTGTLVGTDADVGDAASLTFAANNAVDDTTGKSGYDHRVDGTYGKLYYNEGSGAYIFERDEAAINALGATQNVNDSFTVSVSDGNLASATRDLVFTVNGANDAPVQSANTARPINEGGMVRLFSPNLEFTDVDNTRAEVVYVITEVPDHGELQLNSTALAAGDTFTDVDLNIGTVTYHHDGSENHTDDFKFRVENQDGSGTALTTASDGGGNTVFTHSFTVTAVNDAPVLNAVTGATITDNAASDTGSTVAGSLTGTLVGTDVDAGDAASLTFAANNAVNDTSKGGYDHRVDGTYGNLYYNEGSGVYIFERDEAAINALGATQNVNDTFTVSAVDQHGASSATRDLVFTVVGVDEIAPNNAPVLNTVTGATITDNANSDTGSTVTLGSLTGTLVGTDVDVGDAASLTFAAKSAIDDTSKSGYDHRVDGTYGNLYYNEGSGAYIFERDEAAINALNATQNVNDSFTVSAVDQHGAESATRDLVFTVNGANDAPVLNAVTGATITDNATSDTGSTVAGSLTGTLSGTDADDAHTAASLTFEVTKGGITTNTTGPGASVSVGGGDNSTHSVVGTYGTFYYNEGNGKYIFVRDEAAINALDAGQSRTDTFAVRAVDSDGLMSDPKDLVFTVVGADDAPTTTPSTTITTTDLATYIFKLDDFGFADPDGDTLTSIQILTLPAAGSLMLNNGRVNEPVNARDTVLASQIANLTYVPANGDQNVTASFTYRVRSDSTETATATSAEATLNITVINHIGTAPTLGSVTDAGSVDENSAEDTPISNIKFTPDDVDVSQGRFTASDFTLSSNEAGLSDDQVRALFKVVSLGGTPEAFGLQVNSGADLNFEDKNSYDITVTVRDDNSLEASEDLTVTIDNLNETDATVAIARMADGGTRGNIDAGDVYEATITPDLDQPTIARNYTYQWLNNDSNIEGATGRTYALQTGDAGDNIRVRISYTDPADSAVEEVLSDPVRVNTPATGALTSSLSLTGSAALAQVGGMFTLGNGSITDADGGINEATGVYTVYYSDQTHNNFAELMADTTKGLATKIGVGSSGTFEITKAMFEKQIYGVYTFDDLGTATSSERVFTRLGYFDAGDAVGTATGLAGVLDGNTLNGVIEDSSDNDFYTFTLAERKFVTFTETGTTTNNLSFRLVDSVTGAVQSPNDTTNGDVTTLVTTLEAGDYVVRVNGDVAKYSLTYEEAEPLVITSDATGNTLAEDAEVPARTVVYKATGTSPINNDPISWSLTNNPNNLFAIDSSTGIVTLRQATTPDYSDTNPSYTFTVGASSPSGRTSSQVVTISIAKDISVDTGVVTSGASGITLTEGVAYNAGTVLYTGTGTSTAWLIYDVAEEYNELFTIVAATGLVTLHMPLTPDYEDQASYSITLEGNSIDDFRFGGYRQTVVIQVRNVNDVAPVITSGDTGTALTDGMRPSAAVYTAAGRYDVDAIVWELKDNVDGDDGGLFAINSTSGAVTLKSTAPAPDHETKEDYTFTIVARSGSLVSEQVVTVQVTDVNDVAPTITSGGTAAALIDGERPSAAVYTAEGRYDVDAIVWGLSGADAGLLNIDRTSGAVTLKDTAPTPIYATKPSYSFTVEATSGTLASVTQDVTIQVANPNVAPPVITSSPTGTALIDNDQVMPERVVYKAVATVTDSSPITWRLTGTDATSFNIAPNGDVTFKVATTPNYEAETIYSFTINAQSSGGTTTRDITIQVTDVDESPRITSGNTGDALPEKDQVMSDEVVYQAAATVVDNSTITWSLKAGADAGLFNIASNGAVTFADATTPDFETKASYTFTVMAAGEDGSSTQDVTIAVDNINDVAPMIKSGSTGLQDVLTDEELADAGTVVYRSIGTSDAVPIVWDLPVNPGNLFAIDSSTGVVTLREAITPDFEDTENYTFTVRATSGSLDPVLRVVTVQVTDIDDSPKITSPRTVDLAENTPHSTAVYESMVSNFTVGFWDFDRTVQNDDHGLFDIDYANGRVTLKAGTPTPDFETKSSYTFTITALGISGSVTLSQTITIQVTNVDEVPTATPRSGITTTESMPYNTFAARDFGFADPDVGDVLSSIRIVDAPTTGNLMLNGQAINSGDTVLASAISSLIYTPANINADTNVTFTYKVISTSTEIATAESDTATLTIAVTNVDAIATAITLADAGRTLSIAEDASTRNPIKIGDLNITDVDGGSYGTLELTGTDADKFELNGTVLSLKAGTSLDYETASSLTVRVQLQKDATIGTDVVVNVTDVVETTPEGLAITSGSEESSADGSMFSTGRTFYDADGVGGSIAWSLKDGAGDVDLFNINPASGVVTFKADTTLDRNNGKYEYDFTVVATAGSEMTEQAVKIKVNLAPAISYTTPITGLTGTAAAETIEGTNNKETITTGGGGDLIFAKGKGDTINLGAGADTVVVRFESDAYGNNWSLRDGGDTINNFQYGIDRILLLDISADGNPINNYAEANADTNAPTVALVNASGGIIYDIGFGDRGQTGGDKLKVNFVDRTDSSFSNWISSGNNIEPIFEYITPDDLPSTFFDIT